MPRIAPLAKDQTQGKSAEMLAGVQRKLGRVPNLLSTLAHAPAALGSYLALSGAQDDSSLKPALREQIALAVAGANQCGYCAAAHTAIGKGAGLTDAQTAAALQGQAADPAQQAAIDFARAIVEKRGFTSDDDLAAVRKAGYSDAQVLEIVAVVVLNIFTNYANHIADPEIDFPRVELPQGAGV